MNDTHRNDTDPYAQRPSTTRTSALEQELRSGLTRAIDTEDARDDATAAAARLTQRIVSDGLADIEYASVDSPFGTLHAAVTRRGLVRVAFPEETVNSVLERLARGSHHASSSPLRRWIQSGASSMSTSPVAGVSLIWRSTGL